MPSGCFQQRERRSYAFPLEMTSVCDGVLEPWLLKAMQ